MNMPQPSEFKLEDAVLEIKDRTGKQRSGDWIIQIFEDREWEYRTVAIWPADYNPSAPENVFNSFSLSGVKPIGHEYHFPKERINSLIAEISTPVTTERGELTSMRVIGLLAKLVAEKGPTGYRKSDGEPNVNTIAKALEAIAPKDVSGLGVNNLEKKISAALNNL